MFGGKGVTAQTMFVAGYVCLSPFQVESKDASVSITTRVFTYTVYICTYF